MSRIFIAVPKHNEYVDDTVYEYVTDEDGYSDLRKVYKHEKLFDELKQKKENYLIIPHKELGKFGVEWECSIKDLAKIRLLFALGGTNCGHCGAPWINDESFNQICTIYEDYLDTLVGEMLKYD